MKRLSALLYDETRHNESKHFCERCLHGYKRRDLLERHKPECKGLLKSPTRTEMPKAGENKMAFQNFYKQMKAPYAVYADFECIVRKIHTCELDNKESFTVKTEKHEPCAFSYVVVKSDGQTQGPYTYRGEDAVFVFLTWLQNHEREMREDMANKRPLVMTNEDWQKHSNAAECHICNKSLYNDLYLDSMAVYDPDSGKYRGQSHRRCYQKAVNNRYVPYECRRPKDAIGQWIANIQETCLFCADPLLVPHFKDSVRDHNHITGKYRGAAHNECNFKLKLNSKTMPIPVIFHNLKGYDGHLLMQAMARVQGEIKCIPTNTEKYISFSLGNLRFIDSVNFLLSSLDKLVKGSDEFPIMKKLMPEENKRQLLVKKKGIYPYEYMNSFERFGETKLTEKERFYSSLSGKGITDEEYGHAKQVWETFGCRNLGDYDNLYVATDALLLADVFENFRKVCQDKYGLDPADYYSARGLSWDKIRKMLSSPSFDRFTIFGYDMAGIHMRKTKLVLNKPVYTGMTILENSKILMYEFFYNQMKARYGRKCELVYTDTDSLILDIQTEDVYKDMQEHSWMYDTSNYPKDHPLYDAANKKVLGKMKDECGKK